MKGLGVNKKKLLFKGSELILSEINLYSTGLPASVLEFLQTYFNDSDFIEIETSGSTGTPKKIRLTKAMLKASAKATLQFLNIQLGQKAWACLPTNKVGGLMMLVRWVEGELDLHWEEPSSKPLQGLDQKISLAALTPQQAFNCLDKLHFIDKLILGGGPISLELDQELQKVEGAVYHSYGMTETVSHIALRRINGDKASDCFKALPEVRFSINEKDCLQIDANHLGIKSLQTNDVVALQNDTRFKWLGRLDNVVNSGGVKLFPEKIEEAIGTLPLPYFVMGIPDPVLGEKLILVVESTSAISKEEWQQYWQHLPKLQQPKACFTRAVFCYTETGKLKRKESWV